MKFRLVEKFDLEEEVLNEESYYKVKIKKKSKGSTTYDQSDYVFAIGPKNISGKNLLLVDERHENKSDALPDDYQVVDIIPLKDNKEVLKHRDKLYTITNRQLRNKTSKTLSQDKSIFGGTSKSGKHLPGLVDKFEFSSSKDTSKVDGVKSMKVMGHHPDKDELITQDKRFIKAIPYNDKDKISKMVANIIHQLFDSDVLPEDGGSFKYPVYIFDSTKNKYVIKNVTIKF